MVRFFFSASYVKAAQMSTTGSKARSKRKISKRKLRRLRRFRRDQSDNDDAMEETERKAAALAKLNDEYGEINRKREETERKAAALAKLNDEYGEINRKREETERKAAALAKLNKRYEKVNRRLRKKEQQNERSNAKLSSTIEKSLDLLKTSMERPAFQAAKVDDVLAREVQSVAIEAGSLKLDLVAASARPGLAERHIRMFRKRFSTIRATDDAVQKVTQRAIADLVSEQKELREITTGLRKAIGSIERRAPRATDRALRKEATKVIRSKLLSEWSAKGAELGKLRGAAGSFNAVKRFRAEKVRPDYMWVQKRLEALSAKKKKKKKEAKTGELKGSDVELKRGAFDGGSRVRVFEQLPWFGAKPATAAELKARWPALQWPGDTRAPATTPCQSVAPLGLNRAQKIAVHYLSPFNSAGGGVLVHSAGSGKSATAALIASNLVRDDPERTIWWVTKPGQNHLGRQGIRAATDFNLQQWLNGEPLLDRVLASLPSTMPDRLKRVFLARLSREMTRLSGEKNREDETLTEAQLDDLRRAVEKEGKGKKEEEEPAPREVEEGAAFWAEIRVIRGVFGARWVSCSYEEFAYACGAHLKKADFPIKPERINDGKVGALNAARRKRLEAMGLWGEGKDPLRKACVFIDEAHTITSDAYEANGEPGRVFRLLERMVRARWRSAKLSGAAECAQFYLLTATPVVDHPIDVINLGLLVAPNKPEGRAAYLGSFMDVNINTTKDRLSAKQSTMHRFNVAHTDGQGRIKPEVVADIQNLIRGRFLVFNYVGDKSHFASPRVEWVDVDLSLAQVGSMLEYNAYPREGYVRVAADDGARIAAASHKTVSARSAKGKLVYRDGKLCRMTKPPTKGKKKGQSGKPAKDTCDTEPLQFHEAAQKAFGSAEKAAAKFQGAIDQLGRADALALATGEVFPTAGQVRLVNKKHPGAKLPLPGSTEEKKWARRHAVWPKASTVRDNAVLRKLVLGALQDKKQAPAVSDKTFNPPNAYSAFVARDKLLGVISPVMLSLLDGIHTAREMDAQQLDDYYRFQSGGEGAEGEGGQQRLRYLKQFVHVDTSEKYGSRVVERVLQAAGYQILDFPVDESRPVVVRGAKAGQERAFEDYRGVAVLTSANKSRVLKFFNHPDNRDGRKCLILVGYERFREGIDVLQVGTAHIVGYFSSDADMVQAMFRSLRNCSRNLTPYTPGEGWPLRVRIYNPVFPGTDTSAMDLLSLFDKNLKKTEALRTHISEVYEGAAVDRLLLEPINRMSREVIETLTAGRPSRRMDWTNRAYGGEMDTEEEEE